jgi:uncharacterized protein YqjF (DUF2071 family)
MTARDKQAPCFLTGAWQHLVMLNYPVAPAVLQPYLPAGTEIDFFAGQTYLSVVGFLFHDTRVLGLRVPFHRNFEEVNLRFYVRARSADGWRRGVVFVKEIVPRRLIAWVARVLYNENYVAIPMRHAVVLPAAGTGSVRYQWRHGGRWDSVSAVIEGEPKPLAPGSEEEFITEHYWGDVRQRDGSTVEYQVEHPPWRVWTAHSAQLDCDVAGLYGGEFASSLQGSPASAFVAEGSPIMVRRGQLLATT